MGDEVKRKNQRNQNLLQLSLVEDGRAFRHPVDAELFNCTEKQP